MIDIDVHKDWGSFTLDVKLHHESGILGLLGASGCGKSKTLQCIAVLKSLMQAKSSSGRGPCSTAGAISMSPSRSGA